MSASNKMASYATIGSKEETSGHILTEFANTFYIIAWIKRAISYGSSAAKNKVFMSKHGELCDFCTYHNDETETKSFAHLLNVFLELLDDAAKSGMMGVYFNHNFLGHIFNRTDSDFTPTLPTLAECSLTELLGEFTDVRMNDIFFHVDEMEKSGQKSVGREKTVDLTEDEKIIVSDLADAIENLYNASANMTTDIENIDVVNILKDFSKNKSEYFQKAQMIKKVVPKEKQVVKETFKLDAKPAPVPIKSAWAKTETVTTEVTAPVMRETVINEPVTPVVKETAVPTGAPKKTKKKAKKHSVTVDPVVKSLVFPTEEEVEPEVQVEEPSPSVLYAYVPHPNTVPPGFGMIYNPTYGYVFIPLV
jgi:hypothetical protein